MVCQHLSYTLLKQSRGTKLLQMAFRGEYSENVSNSFSAPLKGECQFMLPPNERIGYPGWDGNVSVMLTQPPVGIPSHIFKKTGIHIGPGGPTNHKTELLSRNLPPIYGQIYKWSIVVYSDDIPGLTSEYREHKLRCLVQNIEAGLPPTVKYQYYNEPEVRRIADESTFKKRMSASP